MPLTPSRSPLLSGRLFSVLLAGVVALVLTMSACTKKDANGGSDAAVAPRDGGDTTTTTTTLLPAPQFAVTSVDPLGLPGPDDATVAGVKETLDEWLATALVGPLRTGMPAGDLSGVFTTEALGQLDDPSVRATLVDEGLPAGRVAAEVATVLLSSVAPRDGGVTLVAARIDVKLHLVGTGLDVVIARDGELVLVQEGDRWKIETFAVRTARDSNP